MPEAGLRELRPAYLAYQWVWSCLDWLFPPECGGCGTPGSRWCRACQDQVSRLPEIICPLCGEPQKTRALCSRCREDPPVYQALRSWAIFSGPVRQALHRLKYKRDISLGEALSQPLILFYNMQKWNVDLVVPVPLSKERLYQRGYNQVSYIARPLALASSTQYAPAALSRVRDTPSQVGLSAEQRRANVANAFQADPKIVRGKNILIMDDVTTTGATIGSCAQALLFAGAERVYGFTLARAVSYRDTDQGIDERSSI